MKPPRPARSLSSRILPIALLNFIAYSGIGLPLAVLPIDVSHTLGYGAVLAGLTVSIQYVATLATRPYAGRMSDAVGPRRTVLIGVLACAVSGLMLALAGLAGHWPLLAFALIVANRLAMGLGESLVGTGNVTWNIGRVGAAHTGKILSYSGMMAYGAIAIGAPVGAQIYGVGSLLAVGIAIIVLSAIGLGIVLAHPPVEVVGGERMSSGPIFAAVTPYGLALAGGSIGFGTLAAFGSLFFANRGWAGASVALFFFGLAFVGARLVFANSVARHGGYKVAMATMSVEALGLFCLWLAPSPFLAYLGALLTGAGFGLVFPALGVVAVGAFPAASRGAAIGAFTVFLDVSLGVAGPLAGWVATRFGYADIFLMAGLAALGGIGMTAWLARRDGERATAATR